MIDFMILAAPRSGTAWAANWLTTERTLCLHDVLFDHAIEEIDKLPCDRKLGIADTGVGIFQDYYEKHPARKVVLHRPMKEVNDSLRKARLPRVHMDWYRKLFNLKGENVMHVDWQTLFDCPKVIHQFLFRDEIPFDEPRHKLLATLNVQVDFEKVDPDPVACRLMIERIHKAVGII